MSDPLSIPASDTAEIVRVLGLHSKRQPLIGHADWRCMYCDWTGPEDEYDLHVATALVAAGIGVIAADKPPPTRVLPPASGREATP